MLTRPRCLPEDAYFSSAVAGAAGGALFITLMSRGTQSAIDDGVNPLQAGADGIHLAFVVAACLSLVLIAAAALVRGRTGAPAARAAESA